MNKKKEVTPNQNKGDIVTKPIVFFKKKEGEVERERERQKQRQRHLERQTSFSVSSNLSIIKINFCPPSGAIFCSITY
jgi:hypothetical protein